MISSGRTVGRAETDATRRRRGAVTSVGPTGTATAKAASRLAHLARLGRAAENDGGTVPLIRDRENGCEPRPDDGRGGPGSRRRLTIGREAPCGCRNAPMTEPDRALFLVVTIKPRKDRLAEAEAQLQSMRRQTLTEPGC